MVAEKRKVDFVTSRSREITAGNLEAKRLKDVSVAVSSRAAEYGNSI